MVGSEESLKESLADVARAWLDHSGKTVAQISRETLIARNTIYMMLNKRRLPGLWTLERFAGAVGTTASKLLEGVVPDRPSSRVGPRSQEGLAEIAHFRLAEPLDYATIAGNVIAMGTAMHVLLEAPELPATLRDRLRAALVP